jgi:GDP-mannose 6-dehydrogenase
MRIVVWGLGYVGTVTAAALARWGHEVVGVDPHQTKVDAINSGCCAIKEPGLEDLVREQVANGRLRAVSSGLSEVAAAQLSFVCVGTPSAADGSMVDKYILNVARDIGCGLRGAAGYHVVVMRSTVFPGTATHLVKPMLERHSDRRIGETIGLVSNPEFLREATALADFAAPPYTVIGESDSRAGDLVEAAYAGVSAPVYRVAVEEAELLKMVCNAFHALKIGFANEVGRVCAAVGLDSHAVMELVCADRKLNISTAYMRPGFAFGGSCLPKDLRSLSVGARRLGVRLPIIEATLESNRMQIEEARLKVHELGVRSVAVLGLSFKSGTDDLRESPVIDLIRQLWQDGVNVAVHDPDVQPDTMLGANLEYLERQLPQIHTILRRTLEEAADHADALIVTQRRPELAAVLERCGARIPIVDFVRLSEQARPVNFANYRGLSWAPTLPAPAPAGSF